MNLVRIVIVECHFSVRLTVALTRGRDRVAGGRRAQLEVRPFTYSNCRPTAPGQSKAREGAVCPKEGFRADDSPPYQ